MDTVAFRRRPSGGVQVTMRKRLGHELETAFHPHAKSAVVV